jgi:AraC family transcriptional regulator
MYNGEMVGVTRAVPFATTFIDLNCPMEMWVGGPFDYLHYYLSRRLLERVALENDVSPLFHIREAFFIEDLVVAQLTKTILMPVNSGEPLDRLALDQIAILLAAHTLQSRCVAQKAAAGFVPALEAWQRLRTEEMLRAHLEGNITVKELASACGLSGDHFARRFRINFGTRAASRRGYRASKAFPRSRRASRQRQR